MEVGETKGDNLDYGKRLWLNGFETLQEIFLYINLKKIDGGL